MGEGRGDKREATYVTIRTLPSNSSIQLIWGRSEDTVTCGGPLLSVSKLKLCWRVIEENGMSITGVPPHDAPPAGHKVTLLKQGYCCPTPRGATPVP